MIRLGPGVYLGDRYKIVVVLVRDEVGFCYEDDCFVFVLFGYFVVVKGELKVQVHLTR